MRMFRRWMHTFDRSAALRNFVFPKSTHTVERVTATKERLIQSQEPVVLQGWINAKPRKVSKKLTFVEFRDSNGHLTQAVARDDVSLVLRALQPDDAVSFKGRVVPRFARKDEAESAHWDLEIEAIDVLNKSNSKPTELLSLRDSGAAFPQEYRYLELRKESFQNNLKFRAKVAKVARDTFAELGFTEIETPLLFKSTPEGAREFLVPTRRAEHFYALPQSPQQYKQLLMASGVKNYYQIARCFRDEDLRADRQPEFTQIDLEMAFADAQDVRDAVQRVVSNIWRETKGLPLYRVDGDESLVPLAEGEAFPKLKYIDALTKYGIDKPDLRYTHTFENLTGYTKKVHGNPDFPVFEACVVRDVKGKVGKYPNALFDQLEYKGRKPVVIPIKSENQDWPAQFAALVEFDESKIAELKERLHLQVGDVIAGATRAQFPYENPTPLGRFRQIAIREMPEHFFRNVAAVSPAEVFVASWVVDFPLFSPSESETLHEGFPVYNPSRIVATHHPFTMALLEDYELLFSDPLRVRGEHYDLVVNGVEVGGGSRRIHHPELQRYIFKEILGIQDPDYLFGHLLQAFATGCPPHAGLAIGFDRLCAMLLGLTSIRDVIAFPKNQAGIDAVVSSPSRVAKEALANYHIYTTK